MSDFFWYNSHDEERYSGPYESREEAIEALEGYGGYIAECKRGEWDFRICGDVVIENIEDANYEQADPDGDGDPIFNDATPEKVKILGAMLTKTFHEWLEQEKITYPERWAFAEIRNREKIAKDVAPPAKL